jgi:hypothetical protein
LACRWHYGKGIFLFIHIEDLRRKTMSRKFIAAAIAVALVLILVPRPSQAAPRGWASLSVPAANLFEKIERWWNLLLIDVEPPSSGDRAPAGQKNGCSMDPNGQVTCDPGGGGTNPTTKPSSAGSGAD